MKKSLEKPSGDEIKEQMIQNALMIAKEFAYLGKLDTGTMKDWLQMAKKMNCTFIAVVMTWALGERNKGNL